MNVGQACGMMIITPFSFIIEFKMYHLSSFITITEDAFYIADIARNFNIRSYDVKVCFIKHFFCLLVCCCCFYKVCCSVRVTIAYSFNENQLHGK